ncbi:hypothetical protein [Scytonema sp. PCC 10023]
MRAVCANALWARTRVRKKALHYNQQSPLIGVGVTNAQPFDIR